MMIISTRDLNLEIRILDWKEDMKSKRHIRANLWTLHTMTCLNKYNFYKRLGIPLVEEGEPPMTWCGFDWSGNGMH